MSSERILIVDDEPQIGKVLTAYLQRDGFTTSLAHNIAQASEELREARPDLMILDLTLPDGNGLDLFRSLKEEGGVPTIMLTARAEELDRVVGLELGADDYITKPFSPREVTARVRAVMRRSKSHVDHQPAVAETLRVRDLTIDERAHDVRLGGRPIALTPSEFHILAILCRNAGQVLTRSQLLDFIDDTGSIYERTLDRHINNLRKKIEPEPNNPSYVVTVFGVGYKLAK